jgi:hypothetical protein
MAFTAIYKSSDLEREFFLKDLLKSNFLVIYLGSKTYKTRSFCGLLFSRSKMANNFTEACHETA